MSNSLTTRRKRLLSRPRPFVLEALEPRLVLDAVSDLAPNGISTGEIRVDVDPVQFDTTTKDPAGSAEPATLLRFSTAEELQEYFLSQAVERWGGLFGTQTHYPVWHEPIWISDLDIPTVMRFSGADGALDSNYSNTNVQVAGVDEGDRVKTDGEYLYIARDNRLLLIDARDPTQLQIASQISLDEHAGQVFVDGNRLTIVSHSYERIPFTRDSSPGRSWDLMIYPPEYTYLPRVVVQVFDITDRTAPQSLSRIELDGSLIQSRAVGRRIVLVTQDTPSLPMPEAKCEPSDPSKTGEGEMRAMPGTYPQDWFRHPDQTCLYETEAEYLARVTPGLLDSLLPHATSGDGTQSFLTAPEQIVVLGAFPNQLVSTTVIDVGGETPVIKGSAGMLTSYASTVYATADNVYVATPNWYESTGEATTITAISLGGESGSGESGSVRVVAAGSVPGHLVNQFSLDEHEGHLRVATTSGWAGTATNGVYVLKAQEDQLVVVGSVTEITPGESLFAARFLGDRAFLVTFERIDPLISLDLSDPTQPAIGGELEIPGFSNYLHPLAGGFLIGLGRNANPETGIAADPQLSLFDVQDLSNPTLLDRELITTGSQGWSPAFFDHHAIQFFADAGILAVPFQAEFHSVTWPFEFQPDGVLRPGAELLADDRGDALVQRFLTAVDHSSRPRSQSGLRVYRVDPTAENPIEALGLVSHEQVVERSLRIGDVLFAVSEDTVTAHRLTDPNERVGGLYVGRHVFDDTATAVFGGEPIRIDVLANDRVPDDARISEISTPVNGGKVEISEDGRVLIYTPPPQPEDSSNVDSTRNWFRPPSARDQFQYTVETGTGLTETGTVHVHLVRRSDPDRGGANPDRFAVRADSESNSLDVLANDFVGKHFIVPPVITEVSSTDQGGIVEIVDGGLMLSYTPAPGFTGVETFTYTVDGGSVAKVTVQVIGEENGPPNDPPPRDPPSSEPLIAIRLAAIDADGNPITRIEMGDAFFVQVFVDDLREAGQGVFAAYVDLPIDQRLVSVTGDVEFSGDYANGISGTLDQRGFDELGAFAESVKPLGDGERLLATIPFEALAAGKLVLAPDAADLAPASESLLYGRNENVLARQLAMSGIELEIVNSFHNDVEPADTNVDGTVSPSDALHIINYLNANGSGPLRRLRDFDLRTEAASGESPRLNRKFDANGDGYCTHMDVLSVINRINADVRRRDEAARGGMLPLQEPGTRNSDTNRNQTGAEGEGAAIDAWFNDSVFVAASASSSGSAGGNGSAGHDCQGSLGGQLDDLAGDHDSSAAADELFGLLGE